MFMDTLSTGVLQVTGHSEVMVKKLSCFMTYGFFSFFNPPELPEHTAPVRFDECMPFVLFMLVA